MPPMDEQREQISAKKTCKVDDQKTHRAQQTFHDHAEAVQRKHVEQKVRPVNMQESRHEQPSVFTMVQDPAHFEEVTIEEGRVLKSFVGYQHIGGNQRYSDYFRLHCGT